MNIWQELDAQQLDDGESLWEGLGERMLLSNYRPQQADNVEHVEIKEPSGKEYLVLHNRDADTYVRLLPEDRFLWERMDGKHTIRDLATAYFSEFGGFAFGRIAGLIGSLQSKGFLRDKPVNVVQLLQFKLASQTLLARIGMFWAGFMQKEFPLPKIDSFFGSFYRRGGWIFYTKIGQLLMALVVVFGVAAFALRVSAGIGPIFMFQESVGIGVLILYLGRLFSLFVHESAHALTVKAYDRRILKGGFMIYIGSPAAYIDTTDMWMTPRRARIAVSWAGPYSDLVLAGLLSLIAVAVGGATGDLLIRAAIMGYFSAFLNLNPLLELDGYYILMDLLELPRLRARSLDFVRTKLPGSLRRLFSLSREEKIMAVFGVMAGIWMGLTIYLAFLGYQRFLLNLIRTALESALFTKILLLFLVGTLALPAVLALVAKLLQLGFAVYSRIQSLRKAARRRARAS